MDIEQHVFDTPDDPGLKMAAKRYTTQRSVDGEKGLTLLLAHCTGCHKEQWEPVIEHMLEHYGINDTKCRIREIWSFDWQGHGDSAVLNRKILEKRPLVSAVEWARAIASFACSPRMKGHCIISIGHSAGATAMMLSTQNMLGTQQPLNYRAMILVEPAMMTRDVFYSRFNDRMSMAQMELMGLSISARRDGWKSRDHAFDYFRKRLPWKDWNLRNVRLMAENGLEETSSGEVKLKCNPKTEAALFRDLEPHITAALQMGRVCNAVPVHIIWGTRNDFVPDFIQKSFSDVAEGRVAASITKIEGAGHMLVQENPVDLAEAILDILNPIFIQYEDQKAKL